MSANLNYRPKLGEELNKENKSIKFFSKPIDDVIMEYIKNTPDVENEFISDIRKAVQAVNKILYPNPPKQIKKRKPKKQKEEKTEELQYTTSEIIKALKDTSDKSLKALQIRGLDKNAETLKYLLNKESCSPVYPFDAKSASIFFKSQNTLISINEDTVDNKDEDVTAPVGRTEEEIKDLKEKARIRISNELFKEGYNEHSIDNVMDYLFNKNRFLSSLKLSTIDDGRQTINDIVFKGREVKVEDFVEHDNQNIKAVVKHNYIFDAEYIRNIGDDEIYKIVFPIESIISILKRYQAKDTKIKGYIQKSLILNALIENLALLNIKKDDLKKVFEWVYKVDLVNTQFNTYKELEDKFFEQVQIAKSVQAAFLENMNSEKNGKKDIELFESIAMVRHNGELRYFFLNDKGLNLYKKAGMKDYFAKYEVDKINPFDVWLKSTKRKEYIGFTFDPSKGEDIECESGIKRNLYKGRRYVSENKVDISIFKEFVYEVMCSSDLKMYYILWSFFAQLLQDPTTKLGTALVLISPQGTGKSIFMDTMGKLWNGYFLKTSKESDIVGQFNKQLMTTQLVYANEQKFVKEKHVDRLKSLITEDIQSYEIKFLDGFTDKSFVRVVIDSNHEHVIYQGLYERRFIYPQISKKNQGNQTYYDMLTNYINQEGFFESLQYDLENYDYSANIKFLRNPPKNKVLLDQVTFTLGSTYKYLMYCLEEGEIPYTKYNVNLQGKLEVFKEDILESYKKFCSNNKLDASHNFHGALKEIIDSEELIQEDRSPRKMGRNRQRYYTLADRQELIEYFEKTYNIPLDNDGMEWYQCTII